MGKGENAGNQHFLLFLQYFLPYKREKSSFQLYLFFLSANAFSLDQSKILLFCKELSLSARKQPFVVFEITHSGKTEFTC